MADVEAAAGHRSPSEGDASESNASASDESSDDSSAALGQKKEKPRGRLYVLDNAKFVLIVCVVLTHFLAPLQNHHHVAAIFEGARFAFMMPTFTFISGYCSSVDLSSPHKYDANIKVVVIYVICQFFYLVILRYDWFPWDDNCFGHLMKGSAWMFTHDLNEDGEQKWRFEDWLHPYWHLWYLFCLVWWRGLLPYWWRLRHPVVTAWLTAAIFCAYEFYKADPFRTWMVDIPYIIAWFPLFCFGAWAKQAKCELWDHPYSPWVGLLAICSIAWIPVVFHGGNGDLVFQTGVIWAYGNSLTNMFGKGFVGKTLMFLCRLAVPVAHGLCIWGFLHLMPRGKLPIVTGGGERCLACYIFHPLGGPLVSLLGVYGTRCDGTGTSVFHEMAIILFCLLSSIFWTSRLVWKVVWPFCDPPVHKILKAS